MERPIPAYGSAGASRYRETPGLYSDGIEPAGVFEHRPGGTVPEVDDRWLPLPTLEVRQVELDAVHATKAEWRPMLVDSNSTLAQTGMSMRAVPAEIVADLDGDKVETGHLAFVGDTPCREHGAARPRRAKALDAGDRHGPGPRARPSWVRGAELRAHHARPPPRPLA